MSRKILPDKKSHSSKKVQVEQLFDNIAQKYVKANRWITMGMDNSWRKNLVREVLKGQATRVLDIATGTADIAIMLSQKGVQHIIGIDISEKMLEIGRLRIKSLNLTKHIVLEKADAEHLPYPDNSFDAATVSFGIRNFEHLETGLSEILRILRPKGIFVVLETSVPENKLIYPFYFIYTRLYLPFIGKVITKNSKAYHYLSKSAVNFPYGKKMVDILRKVGFKEVKSKGHFFNSAMTYVCKK